jgi:pyruvate dehydrogenase E2 component (dihydrolipoamide acetyltransferase)
MLHELTMPKLSPTMTEGVIAKWHKKKGDQIAPGDLLLEIATDKATVEHNAIDPGWLREIVAQEGTTIEVNALLAFMTDEEKEPYEPKATATVAIAPKQEVKTEPKVELKAATPSSDHIAASPLAKKLAKESGIDLSSVHGTGPRGRIMSRDLEKESILPKDESKKKVVMSQMRKVIAERLSYAKKMIPHFYITQSVDVTDLVNMREELKKEGRAYTVTDFIVKATANSLMESPNMRMSFDEKEQALWQFPHADISLAVSIEGGLITPVLFQAEKMPLDTISKEVKRLAEKARSLKLTPEEYTGGCFTITNLGMYGVSSFYAIINPPQAAILSVGAAEEELKKIDSIIVTRKILTLSLAVDHRVIDGAVAAQFLQSMKKYLEKPYLLFLN